jgi:hypothetical protein
MTKSYLERQCQREEGKGLMTSSPARENMLLERTAEVKYFYERDCGIGE